jgi:hypothetical protein
MPGKVFEIGFPKTGTTSLCQAASILGLRATNTLIEEGSGPWHERPARAHDLLGKWLADRYDFDVIEEHDYIGSIFFPIFREIDRQVPDARFILTVREPEGWIRSVGRFMGGYRHARVAGPLELDLGMLIRLKLLGLFDTRDEARLLEAYASHNESVRRHFGASPRLLVMDVCAGDGWEPLCAFLGRPVPAVPFPHANRSGTAAGT